MSASAADRKALDQQVPLNWPTKPDRQGELADRRMCRREPAESFSADHLSRAVPARQGLIGRRYRVGLAGAGQVAAVAQV